MHFFCCYNLLKLDDLLKGFINSFDLVSEWFEDFLLIFFDDVNILMLTFYFKICTESVHDVPGALARQVQAKPLNSFAVIC